MEKGFDVVEATGTPILFNDLNGNNGEQIRSTLENPFVRFVRLFLEEVFKTKNDGVCDLQKAGSEEAWHKCFEDLHKKGMEDDKTMVNVSLSIWYSKEFAEVEEDVQGYIDICFEEANAGLANSKVPMRLKHHGTYFYDGKELPKGAQMISAFGPYAGLTLAKRESILKTADAALLLVRSADDVGGIAYVDSYIAPFAMATHAQAKYDTEDVIYICSFVSLFSLIHFSGANTHFFMS